MTLADLRKMAVRQNIRIRFAAPHGLECVITEHGIAQIPSLDRVPDFDVESALRGAGHFTLEPVATGKQKAAAARRIGARELAALAASGTSESAHPDEHDE